MVTTTENYASKSGHYYSEVSGLYRPSFFQTEINFNGSLENLDKLPDKVFETFLHEYIHFLQDISTTFGLTNTCFVVEYMKYIVKEIRESPEDTFQIPVQIKQEKYHKVYENSILMKLYTGTSNHVNIPHLPFYSIERNIITVPLGSEKLTKIPQITIQYLDSNKRLNSFHLGSTIIMENMATLIARIFTKNVDKWWNSTTPYHAAELIALQVYPEFAKDPINTLALCDTSLFSFHPGDLFYIALCHMRDNKWLPKNPMEIYYYCNSILPVNYPGAKTMPELYDIQKKEAIKELQEYFTNEMFKDNKKWIELVIDNVSTLRKKRPSFIIDIAIGGKKVFAEIIREIGTSQINNFVGKNYFFHPEQDKYDFKPYGFAAINELSKIFMNEKKGCSIRHICQYSATEQGIDDYTDDKCANEPWERSKYEILCPFAQIWKMWGISGKKPIFNISN